MVDRRTTHLLSLKSLLVMSMSIGSFGLANSIEYSPYEGVSRRGVPLTYLESKYRNLLEGPLIFGTSDGEIVLIPGRKHETIHTFALVFDMAVAIVASVLLGIASERLFFNKARGTLRSGERPIR